MKLVLQLFFINFCFFSYSFSFNHDFDKPSDTVTSIIDKSSALIMLEEGKRLYYEGKIKDALIHFRQVSKKDPNSWRPPYWISNCHFKMSNYGFALKYANQAITKNHVNIDPEVYNLLGDTYHQLEKLDSALINYSKAQLLIPTLRSKNLNISSKIEQCRFAKNIFEKGDSLTRHKLSSEINSGYDEYGAVLSKDGKIMYFTARRNDTKGAKANPDDQEYFEDIYRAIWNDEANVWDSVSNNIDRINSYGFDSFSDISDDGLIAYLTINNTYVKGRKKTKGSDIFKITFSNKGRWSSPKKIQNQQINSSFFDGSPSLTADGNTMYFVSDRKGKKRSTDIYVVNKIDDNNWGEPIVLSDSVNTTEGETTPFITPDGRYLFFSSNGHVGMGGMDIFVSENLGGGLWSKAINLGGFVNTVNNDTHFKYYPQLNKAMLAGYELIGKKSSIDIYEVDMTDFKYPEFY